MHVQATLYRVSGGHLLELIHCGCVGFVESIRIGRLGHVRPAPFDDDTLQVLGTTHCTSTPSPGGATVGVDPAGEASQLLPGRANAHHSYILPMSLPHERHRLLYTFAPQVRRIVQSDGAILDNSVGGPGGFAFENQAVKTRPLELRAGPTAHMRVRTGAGEG